MKARIAAFVVMILFLWGNVQAAGLPDSFSKRNEIKTSASSFVKWMSLEKIGDEGYHSSTVFLFSHSTPPVFTIFHAPVSNTSFIHKSPSRAFILYRVLRN